MCSDKCHFMCLRKNTESDAFFLNNTEMKNSNKEEILRIIFNIKSSKFIEKNSLRKLLKISELCHV